MAVGPLSGELHDSEAKHNSNSLQPQETVLARKAAEIRHQQGSLSQSLVFAFLGVGFIQEAPTHSALANCSGESTPQSQWVYKYWGVCGGLMLIGWFESHNHQGTKTLGGTSVRP